MTLATLLVVPVLATCLWNEPTCQLDCGRVDELIEIIRPRDRIYSRPQLQYLNRERRMTAKRRDALVELSELGDSALPALRQLKTLVEDPIEPLSSRAIMVEIIGRWGAKAKSALPALERISESGNVELSDRAKDAIVQIESSIEFQHSLVHTSHDKVNKRISSLKSLDSAAAFPILVRAYVLDGVSGEKRDILLPEIGEVSSKLRRPGYALMRLLQSSNPERRKLAWKLLDSHKFESASYLIRKLSAEKEISSILDSLTSPLSLPEAELSLASLSNLREPSQLGQTLQVLATQDNLLRECDDVYLGDLIQTLRYLRGRSNLKLEPMAIDCTLQFLAGRDGAKERIRSLARSESSDLRDIAKLLISQSPTRFGFVIPDFAEKLQLESTAEFAILSVENDLMGQLGGLLGSTPRAPASVASMERLEQGQSRVTVRDNDGTKLFQVQANLGICSPAISLDGKTLLVPDSRDFGRRQKLHIYDCETAKQTAICSLPAQAMALSVSRQYAVVALEGHVVKDGKQYDYCCRILSLPGGELIADLLMPDVPFGGSMGYESLVTTDAHLLLCATNSSGGGFFLKTRPKVESIAFCWNWKRIQQLVGEAQEPVSIVPNERTSEPPVDSPTLSKFIGTELRAIR